MFFFSNTSINSANTFPTDSSFASIFAFSSFRLSMVIKFVIDRHNGSINTLRPSLKKQIPPINHNQSYKKLKNFKIFYLDVQTASFVSI